MGRRTGKQERSWLLQGSPPAPLHKPTCSFPPAPSTSPALLQSLDMFVDSAGDDVYHWDVELSGFSPACALAKVRGWRVGGGGGALGCRRVGGERGGVGCVV